MLAANPNQKVSMMYSACIIRGELGMGEDERKRYLLSSRLHFEENIFRI
jgi:hypothetical protein